MTPGRFKVHAVGLAVPDEAGDLVRFADVEPALRDSARLAWLLPVLEGDEDDPAANRRSGALSMGLQLGLTGLPLVDMAMEACGDA